MEVSVRVYRILRHLASYLTLASDAVLDGIIPLDGEKLLGVYRNDPADHKKDVVVSDYGLRWWENGEVLFVRYSDIAKSEVLGEKTTADSILLRTSLGKDRVVKIEGGSGTLREVWEFKRFINRVVADTQ